MIHDFKESLERSHAYEDAPWWDQVYRDAFPDLAAMVSTREDGWAQRGGIDRVLTLTSGRTITVDEKVREKTWGDVLLETWSDKERKIPGWMQKKLAIDFIAYAYADSGICLLLPFNLLRRAWLQNGMEWARAANEQRDGFKKIMAENSSYITESIVVPRSILLDSIRDAIVVRFDP
jgi:hypothetical protein